jgi:3-methyladenine DNA glycosylase AlkD
MNPTIQEIQKRLYLRRDGAASSSMREKGVEYKVNFGVSILTLREIAKEYAPNAELANELWKQDTRELKLLATLIQDVSSFDQSDEWMNEINNIELAEQATMNLFSKIKNPFFFAQKWVNSKKLYAQITGFILYSRLFILDFSMNEKEEKAYFLAAFDALNSDSLLLKNKSFNSLKQLGKQSVLKSKSILAQLDDNIQLSSDLKENLYEELA